MFTTNGVIFEQMRKRTYLLKKLFLIVVTVNVISSGSAQDLSDGYYQVVSESLQKGINIPNASESQGVKLIVWDKNDCKFNQQWKLDAVGNAFVIKSRYNNLVLTAKGLSVVQMSFLGSPNQLWEIEESNGSFTILLSGTNMALSTLDVTAEYGELVLEAYNQSYSQMWNFESARIEADVADFNRVLSPKEMKGDVEYFFDKLVEVHVNPYAFVSKDSLEQRKMALLNSLSQPLARYQFVRKISALNGMFDGHTGVVQKFDNDYFEYYKYNYGRLLPGSFEYTNEEIWYTPYNTPKNKFKIETINTVSIKEIVNEIEKRINLENKYWRKKDLEYYFQEYLFGLFNIQSPYSLKLVDDKTGKREQVEIVGIPYFLEPKTESRYHSQYNFRVYPQDSIAIIEHNTCSIGRGTPERARYNAFVDSVFVVVKELEVKHLFIDVSRNSGGSSDVNDVFYRNINHKPNPWKFNCATKVSLESKLHYVGLSSFYSSESYEQRLRKFNSYVKTERFSENQMEFVELKNGVVKNYQNIKNSTTVVDGYSNNIYLVQGFKTYSAAMDIVAWFKYGKVGVSIGTETGGTTEVYIEALPMLLPNSNIAFRIADKYNKYPGGKLNEGVKPDVDLGNEFYKNRYELNDLQGFIKAVDAKNSIKQ